IFDVDSIRYCEWVKVSQIGWYQLHWLKTPLFEGVNEDEFMYLVHSYYAPRCKEAIALTDYEVEYASALHKNNFYGVQFHPEKSSAAGARILENFLKI